MRRRGRPVRHALPAGVLGAACLLLVSASSASAQAAQTEFYAGAIGTSRVELAILSQDAHGPHRPSQGLTPELIGAIYWVEPQTISWRGEPLKRLHGIVGAERRTGIEWRELTSLDDA